jgi:hypothetical protein
MILPLLSGPETPRASWSSRTLGLTIPPAVLARADEIIQ